MNPGRPGRRNSVPEASFSGRVFTSDCSKEPQTLYSVQREICCSQFSRLGVWDGSVARGGSGRLWGRIYSLLLPGSLHLHMVKTNTLVRVPFYFQISFSFLGHRPTRWGLTLMSSSYFQIGPGLGLQHLLGDKILVLKANGRASWVSGHEAFSGRGWQWSGTWLHQGCLLPMHGKSHLRVETPDHRSAPRQRVWSVTRSGKVSIHKAGSHCLMFPKHFVALISRRNSDSVRLFLEEQGHALLTPDCESHITVFVS